MWYYYHCTISYRFVIYTNTIIIEWFAAYANTKIHTSYSGVIVALGVPAGSEMTCKNNQKVSSKYRCIFEFDEYGIQRGCKDMSHLDGCGKSWSFFLSFFLIIYFIKQNCDISGK